MGQSTSSPHGHDNNLEDGTLELEQQEADADDRTRIEIKTELGVVAQERGDTIIERCTLDTSIGYRSNSKTPRETENGNKQKENIRPTEYFPAGDPKRQGSIQSSYNNEDCSEDPGPYSHRNRKGKRPPRIHLHLDPDERVALILHEQMMMKKTVMEQQHLGNNGDCESPADISLDEDKVISSVSLNHDSGGLRFPTIRGGSSVITPAEGENSDKKADDHLVEPLVVTVNRITVGDVKPIHRIKSRAPSSTGSTGTSSDSYLDISAGGMQESLFTRMKEPVSLRDFEVTRSLGKGSHGHVFLVRHKRSGVFYAMKQLKKLDVMRRKQEESTLNELEVHTRFARNENRRCPYIVPLRYAFHTRERLYMVFDFCAGGELYLHIKQRGCMPEELTVFYAAEIALAIGYLHACGIVYRDLKPENLLLDSEGHIHLVDFGLCQQNVFSATQGSHSFCGTTEYLAPEILRYNGHGYSVDWWSFGMVIYEMLTGLPPWYSYDQDRVVDGILHGKLEFPDHVSESARSLLRGLLRRDPRHRLGSKGIQEVMTHEFFRTIDWVSLANRGLEPPFVPPDDDELCNFDPKFTSMPLEIESHDSQPGSDYGIFRGFYFDYEEVSPTSPSSSMRSSSSSSFPDEVFSTTPPVPEL